MFGNISPFFTNWGPATATQGGILTASAQTIGGAKTWTGAQTITVTAISGAENILTMGTSDDAVAKIEALNGSGTDSLFLPSLKFTGNGANIAFYHQLKGTTDTGTNPLWAIDYRIGASTAVVTRPLQESRINGIAVLQHIPLNSGADSALLFKTAGSAAPAFTTRPAGARLVLRDVIDGTHVDMAYGSTTAISWASIPQATSSYAWAIYGGTTNIFQVNGDGKLITTAGKVRKARIALTSPVTLAVTDDIVITKLTTPGPVAVNGFASPFNGTELVLIDGTGDANVNNITFTPASGNVNGAASKAYSAAYGRWTLTYESTTPQWLSSL